MLKSIRARSPLNEAILRHSLYSEVTNSGATLKADRRVHGKMNEASARYQNEIPFRHKNWKTIYESAVVHKNKLICFSTLMTKV